MPHTQEHQSRCHRLGDAIYSEEIFRETHMRPTKRRIRHLLEEEKWGIHSKDREARWAKRFRDAGLENLKDDLTGL